MQEMDPGFRRPATLADWLCSPERLSVAQSAFLVGMPEQFIEDWVTTGAVDAYDDADGATLVDRDSLRDFWELVHDELELARSSQ